MSEGQDMAAKEIEISGKEWKKYTAVLNPKETVVKGKLRIFLCKPENAVDVEHVSLFPADTRNGLRPDLVQKLADLKPGVFRFPGGCIVEGTDLATRYQWKNSVDRWKTEKGTKTAGRTPSAIAISPTIAELRARIL